MTLEGTVGDTTTSLAVDWYLRFVRDDMSSMRSEELAAWARWSSQPENLERFRSVRRTWEALELISPDAPRPTSSELAADEYDGSIPISQWLDERTRSNVSWIPPGERLRVVKRVATFLSVAACLALLTFALTRYTRLELLFGGWERPLAFGTAPTEHRFIHLSDGTSLTLAPGTQLTVLYTRNRRDVVLDHGEAWFRVARNPERPFIVFAGSGAISVIGTEFDVRRERDAASDDRVIVTVDTGSVEVGPPPSGKELPGVDFKVSNVPAWTPARLVRGEEITYDATGPRTGVEAADLRAAGAWKEGHLEFRYTPLKDVIQQVNRYSDKRIVLSDDDDGAVGSLPFSGTVYEGQVPGWLQALQTAYPVEVTEYPERVVVRMRNDPPNR